MYLLDTNICIYAMKGTYPELNRKLLNISPDEISVSAVTVGELEYGAAKSRWGEKTRMLLRAFLANFDILPFTEEDAIAFGNIRAHLAMSGQLIGAYDMMIAAQGIAEHRIVVTHNTGEFIRVPGIVLEDWT